MQPTLAEGLKLAQFYTVNSAQQWLEANSKVNIHSVSYANNPTSTGDNKHWVLISYKND